MRGAATGVGVGQGARDARSHLRRPVDVGLGAGWYEPEYEAIGMEMPRPGDRIARLTEAVDVVKGLLGGGPLTYDGRFHARRTR